MQLEQPHTFSHDEARQRVRALGDYLQNKHGMQVSWSDDDTVKIRGKYTVVEIDVDVRVESARVQATGKDPGMLLRATAKKYVSGKLETYLDPRRPVDGLPRR